MNNTRYDPKDPNAPQPRATLSTLGPAIDAFRNVRTANRGVLALFWHGSNYTPKDSPIPFLYCGFIQSGVGHTIDFKKMLANQAANPWNSFLFPFGWANRNANAHYKAVCTAIKNLKTISAVHLYGCTMGKDEVREALMGFVADIQKEVWAYGGFTNVREAQFQVRASPKSRQTMTGVKQTADGKYKKVALSADRGRLPGWQFRGRVEKGEVRLDVFDASYSKFRTWAPGSTTDAEDVTPVE